MKVLAVLVLLCGVANAHTARTLLQGATGIVVGDPDIDNSTVVYQKVSQSTGDLQSIASSNGWVAFSVVASLELSTNASYAYNYKDGNGTTRFNTTVRLARSGSNTMASSTSPGFTARLQTVSCGSANLDSNFLLGSQGQELAPLTILPAANNYSQSMSTAPISNSTIYDVLVDYDEAQSIGIYGGSTLVACQNLKPPFPDFPNDWAATIEITDAVNGTTFVMRETYSQTVGKVRSDVHSYGNNHIIITDASSSSRTMIHSNNGSCSDPRNSRRANWMTGSDNTTLLSTADLLHFSNDSAFDYSPGPYDVRGIQCERWSNNVTLNRTWANATFSAYFYFPVNQWQVAREDYHRMLKRVYLNGTWNGRNLETYTEYVNFRPIQPFASSFDICAISPYGSNCNCTDAKRKAAFKNVTQALSSDGDSVDVAGAEQTACNYGGAMPHGFVSAQSGPYVGLTIIGMIGGSLITGIAMYLIYRKRTGVTITDNFSHQKFQDAPGT